MPSRRRKESDGGECIDLHNVRRYLHLLCFYKANIAAVLATGRQLTEVGNLEEFIERYNAWVEELDEKRLLPKYKSKEDYLLTLTHFQTCDTPLSTSLKCLVEARENMRNFASPFKELRKMFRMIPAFDLMIRLADATLKVKVGKKKKGYIFAFAIVDALDVLGASQTMAINREFYATARDRILGPTQLYVLAASILALHNAADAAKLVLQNGKAFTSVVVDGRALPRRYARFYVDLVRANSEYADAAASALLAYMNVRDPGRLYGIVRSMTYALERRGLRGQEAEALMRLLEHEARVEEGR
jgi:hypothetical protein